MTGGVVSVSRCLWDDVAFRNEPFSEREAWIWMIAEASWKDREKRSGAAIVKLKRGQLAHSTRFLSDAWDWHHSKVRRFLERLENRHMIERTTDTGVSIIFITKYDTYQLSPDGYDTAPTQQPTQHRHSTDTNENKGVIKMQEGEEYDTDVSLPFANANDASEAVRIYNETASRCGWPAVQKMTPARSRSIKARLADAGGLIGWQDAIDRAEQSDFLNARTPKPWTGFGFDWLIKSSNFTKLMEGNYDNRTHGQTANANAADREIAFAARFARTPSEDCF